MISWSSSSEGMRILEAEARFGEEEDDDPGPIAVTRGAERSREERRGVAIDGRRRSERSTKVWQSSSRPVVSPPGE